MKYLRSSNSSVRLVELDNGEIGFAAKIAPIIKKGDIYGLDRTRDVTVFYPAEKIVAGECVLSSIEIFGYEAQCENATHYFPTFEALGEERKELSCEDVYLFSNCDFRQNNPVVGVHTKEAPHPGAEVYAIKKGTEYVPLQNMDNKLTYCLISN